ncbi:MAG: BamA/TamA family outer membrane protein [Deltaproteobacteria bacterium]|nr:BamA/TamA family outer membrane protein [Deltaproteobacteria bacterium]
MERSVRPLGVLSSALCVALLVFPTRSAVSGMSAAKRRAYEARTIAWALRQAKLERYSGDPAGRLIERVVIVRERIISDSDPWPNLFNIVHVRTREHIIRQELLFVSGERYDPRVISESERNLRALGGTAEKAGQTLAIARIIPCRGSTPNGVVVLVVTKDLWSIRLNMVYQQTGSVVGIFDTSPQELNFLGLNKILALHLRVTQFDFSEGAVRDQIRVGGRYVDPRLLGSRLSLSLAADAIIEGSVPCAGETSGQKDVWCPEKGSGALGGVVLSASLTRPLFSLATEWAFELSTSLTVTQQRNYQQGSDGHPLITVVPVSNDIAVPLVYDAHAGQTTANFTRSFGRRLKHDLTFGITGYRYEFTPPANTPFGPEAIDAFRRTALPRSETASVFGLRYDLRPTRYVKRRNVRGFALSEDYAIGPRVAASINFGQNLVRSAESFISLAASASYQFAFGDDLLYLGAEAGVRYQPDIGESDIIGPWVYRRASGTIHNISPVWLFGRLHARASLSLRDNNLDYAFSTLGGDTGLRGYPNDQFAGRNLLHLNVEFRTLPLELWTLHGGAVVFYDAGSAFGKTSPSDALERKFVYRQSVGVGLRGHFPQFDRESLRIDLGVPLSSGRSGFGTWFSIAFGQVF